MSKKQDIFDDIDRFLDKDIYIDKKIIFFGGNNEIDDDGEVNYFTSKNMIKKLLILDNFSANKPINIIMDTPGGDVFSGLAIYDTIKLLKSKVNIIVIGSAMSMGSVILQSANKRIMSKNARLMLHDGYVTNKGAYKTAEAWSYEIKRDQDKYYKILFEKMQNIEKNDTLPKQVVKTLKFCRSPLKGCFTLKDVEALNSNDLILNSQECLQLNLIDEIIETSFSNLLKK